MARLPALAIDLGTSRVRVVTARDGIVADQACRLAVREAGALIAAGDEAARMMGRTPPGVRVLRPMKQGVVSDPSLCSKLLAALLKPVRTLSLRKPSVVVAVGPSSTAGERQLLRACLVDAGVGEVHIVPSLLLAALGSEVPITLPAGALVMDVGAGQTSVGVVSLGGIAVSKQARTGGDSLDAAIATFLKTTNGLVISERTARALKREVGTLTPNKHSGRSMRVRGRLASTQAPHELDVSSEELAPCLRKVSGEVRDVLLAALKKTPPVLAADVLERGLVLCGGGAQLRGLPDRLREDTGLAVVLMDEPDRRLALGAQQLLQDAVLFERMSRTYADA